MWADFLSPIGCFILQDGVAWFHHSGNLLFSSHTLRLKMAEIILKLTTLGAGAKRVYAHGV